MQRDEEVLCLKLYFKSIGYFKLITAYSEVCWVAYYCRGDGLHDSLTCNLNLNPRHLIFCTLCSLYLLLGADPGFPVGGHGPIWGGVVWTSDVSAFR